MGIFHRCTCNYKHPSCEHAYKYTTDLVNMSMNRHRIIQCDSMLVYKINGSLSLMVYLKPVNISNVSWIYKRLEQSMIMTPVELLSNVRRVCRYQSGNQNP